MRVDRDFVTGGGVRLAVRAAGPVGAPAVVLLHGWAQSGAVWTAQLTGPLSRRYRLLAPDLRGHGDSDAPESGYDDPAAWAADVRALLDYAGTPAVLVGWSYGGLVITDYLRVNGPASTADVAGIVLVGAITEIGRGHPGGRTGPAMRAALPDALSPDRAIAEPAVRAFATRMSADPARQVRPTPLAQELLETTLRVPARVRAALFGRDVASTDVLAAIDVPTLVVHGRADAVVDPSAAEYAAARIPGARLRWFDRVGHLPFLERPAEFDEVLAEFVDAVTGPADAAARPLGSMGSAEDNAGQTEETATQTEGVGEAMERTGR